MEKPELLCIAHRGAMGHAPENTLASVQKAIELGASCIEIDAYYVEGHLIVFHDDRLERTTDGTGYLSDHSFEQLRSLDAGYGQQIPTLDEVCEIIDTQTCLNIELKGENTAAPVARLISKQIQKGWDIESFLVSSFRHRDLQTIKQLIPDIKIGALLHGLLVEDAKFAEDLGAFSVHPSIECIDKRFVDDAHDRCLRVYAYGADYNDDIDKMYALGVDGVFTGFPERVAERYSQGSYTTRWCDR